MFAFLVSYTCVQGDAVQINIEVTQESGEHIPLEPLGSRGSHGDLTLVQSGDESTSLLATPPQARRGRPQRRRQSSRPAQEAIDVRSCPLASL